MSRTGGIDFEEVVDRLMGEEERWHREKSNVWDGLSTSFPSLDRFTGGFHPGEVVVIGARTGHGKTSFGNQMCWQVARQLQAKHEQTGVFPGKVVLFSPEMRDTQVFMRQAALMSGVASWDLQTGRAADDEREEWRESLRQMRELEPYFTIVAGENVFLGDIKTAIQVDKGKIKLLCVDYVQRIMTEKSGNAYERVSNVSRDIKELANKNDLTILVMAQLNREMDKDKTKDGKPRKPQLSDLQNSSGIEQDADTVIFVHRHFGEEYRSKDVEIVELIIAKQRSGPQAEIEIRYYPHLTKFEDPLW